METLPFVAAAAVATLSVHTLLDKSYFHLLHYVTQTLRCASRNLCI